MSGLHPGWRAFGRRLGALALVCAPLGWATDARLGMGVAIAWLVWLMSRRTRDLVQLARWIDGGRDEDFPQTTGFGGEVFLALSRRLRWDARARKRGLAEADRFRETLQALPDGVVVLDALGHIEWGNPAASTHLGLDLARDRGHALAHLVRQPGFAEFIATGTNGDAHTLVDHGGAGRRLGLRLVRMDDGRSLLVSFDQAAMHRAESMQRDFVANVSHELRTPLTVIAGFLEHLAEPDEADQGRARAVALMQTQSERMLRLLDELLLLSRLEATAPPTFSRVAMAPLLDELIEAARALSGGRHPITLRMEAGDLEGVRSELASAFGNLLANAVRYTPDGGAIRARWFLAAEGPVFEVSDEGPGIAAEHLPRLTERFYRVDRGRSRERGGTGLGLTIVHQVLERHGGELRIDSHPGEGSRFAAHFPTARHLG